MRGGPRTERSCRASSRAPSGSTLSSPSLGGSVRERACGGPATSLVPEGRGRPGRSPPVRPSRRSLFNRGGVVRRALFFLHAHGGNHVPEELREVEDLVHEVLRDSVRGIEAEYNLEVVDLAGADDL